MGFKRREFLKTSGTGLAAFGLGGITLACKDKKKSDVVSKVDVKKETKIPFKMVAPEHPDIPERVFNIQDFGAIEGGRIKATASFSKAIANADASGGGRIVVPKGKWLTGAIHLKDNIELHLTYGAELYFSHDPQDYLPIVFTRWAGYEIMNYSPLIYANGCKNIAITGKGKLFGNGKLWEWKKWKNREDGPEGIGMQLHQMVLNGVPPEQRIFGLPEKGNRPQFINLVNCEKVLLDGFSIAEPGPFWTIHILYSNMVRVNNVSILTQGVQNTDGIDIDSSRNVIVENCFFDTHDNSVAIKSGVNEDGRRVGKPSENIVIRNIKAVGKSIAIGSEMSGGVRNVLISDCEFTGTKGGFGFRIKSNPSRGGFVENVWIKNYFMKTARRAAIAITTKYFAWMAGTNEEHPPLLKNINLENIYCQKAETGIVIESSKERPIEELSIKNVSINALNSFSMDYVKGLELQNVVIKPLPQ
ncbi:glycoside hydrolase family 28 protein [Mariniphaga sediminis]|uniref:glycoside hydrolase family 28 protein n=1 Tax=Mariniphaga sediminis TaxID=1628158 RepID=UPI003565719D